MEDIEASKNLKKWKKLLEKMTDEEVLASTYLTLATRVDIATEFVQNEEGALTHETLILKCGDKVFTSEPQPFEWPLQMLPVPEALKKKLN